MHKTCECTNCKRKLSKEIILVIIEHFFLPFSPLLIPISSFHEIFINHQQLPILYQYSPQ